jgi:hypothetical protein
MPSSPESGDQPPIDKIKTVHLEGINRHIDDSTPIVRYMKLETLLLLLFERRAFIPSHATLGRLDPLETGILFDLPNQRIFWQSRHERLPTILNRFLVARQGRDTNTVAYQIVTPYVWPQDAVDVFITQFHTYVDELANERCIWCWNKFSSYSNALWQLYGNRGVAIRSTVGDVKNALIKSGVERGIVAPIAYIDYENIAASDVLNHDANIFRPYLLKNIAFDYEKEIRLILPARHKILRDRGGVLPTFEEADFFKVELFPYYQREKRLVVDTVITNHLNKPTAERFPPSSDGNWNEIYNRYNGTPFTTEDSVPFSDAPLGADQPP